MRCPGCEASNPDDAAICVDCGGPLTPYAASAVAEADPARTAARMAAERHRPGVSTVLTAADSLVAAAMLLRALGAMRGSPQLNADATNYIQHAFGGLQAIVTAVLLLLAAGGLGVLAWGAWTQESWAWTIHALLLAALTVYSVVTLMASPFRSLALIAACGVGVWQMSRPAVRRWYGAE